MTERVAADRRGHAVHHLSFWGRIVSFYRGDESNASEILFRSLTFNREHNCFVDAEDVSVLYRTRVADVDIVTCACVYDVQKRVTTPFILLKQGNKDGSYEYSLLGLSSSIKQETKVTFKLPYQLRDKVHIMHGPVVLWTHAGEGFYTSILEKQDVAVVRPTPTCVSRPLIGVLPLHKGDVFIIGPMTSQFNKTFPKTEISGHETSESLGCLLLSAGHLDATVMLPSAYVPITQTMLVLCAEKLNGVLVKSSLVAATSEKQLILFEDGVPQDVCQLPFDAPEDIHVVDTGRNGRLVTVSFDQGHVCAVWKESFQVAGCWSAVRSVHVDDFLGCGTEQLLLVFEEDERSGRTLDRFLLTDLCGISLSNVQRSNMDAASEPAGHNQLLTFQALESRLQSGLTVVQQLQRDDRLKQKVLLQSIRALTDLVSGRDPVVTHPEQEGLFPLWDEEDSGAEVCDEEMQVAAAPGGGPSSRPRVESLWRRVTEDHLVVGATLTADGAVPLDCVSLSVLTNAVRGSAPAVIQTRSQVFLLTSPTSSPSSPASSSSPSPDPPGPAAKRSKGDDDGGPDGTPGGRRRLAVTAVTPLTPLLTRSRIRCPVVLHYRGETAGPDAPAPAALQCGEVVLDIRADPRGRLLPDPELATEEDLLTALSVLDHGVFLLDSPQHSLGDVEHWLQTAACCKRLKVNPQYLAAHPEGPSAAVLLRWSPASVFQGRLSVHGSRLQMLRFLERLCSFLPPCCSVRHLRGPGPRAGPRAAALALENEALELKRAAASLLGGDEERRGGGGAPEDRASGDERGGGGRRRGGDLGGPGPRPPPPVDAARYRGLTRRLTEVQLRADVAVLLQAGSWDSGPRWQNTLAMR